MNNSAESFVLLVCSFLTLILTGVKLVGIMSISWFWVFFPLIVCFGIILIDIPYNLP